MTESDMTESDMTGLDLTGLDLTEPEVAAPAVAEPEMADLAFADPDTTATTAAPDPTDRYLEAGTQRAAELGNRGPLAFAADGTLAAPITEAYWRTGFYIFEGVLEQEEVADLVADFERLRERAHASRSTTTDAPGHRAPAAGPAKRPRFSFAKPLSDPYGGTDAARGRYQARMAEHAAPADAPDEVLSTVGAPLQDMDSFLRLYGHPRLLAVAAEINGPDFVPFREAIWVKEPGLGPSTAWHQDGTTHWDNPELDAGTHGFNFMAQLYPTTPANALWLVPCSHCEGKIDIKARIAANGGSDRLPDAVPMVCNPGDIAIVSRQILHGAYANRSPNRRVSLTFGFHRRRSIAGVLGEAPEPYDDARIHRRARVIALAIDARHQRFPDEPRFHYQPLADEIDDDRWSEAARATVLNDYELNDLGI